MYPAAVITIVTHIEKPFVFSDDISWMYIGHTVNKPPVAMPAIMWRMIVLVSFRKNKGIKEACGMEYLHHIKLPQVKIFISRIM